MDPVLYGNRPRSYLSASLRCSHHTISILRTHRALSIATAPPTSDNTVMLSGTDYSNVLSPRWLQLRAPSGATRSCYDLIGVSLDSNAIFFCRNP